MHIASNQDLTTATSCTQTQQNASCSRGQNHNHFAPTLPDQTGFRTSQTHDHEPRETFLEPAPRHRVPCCITEFTRWVLKAALLAARSGLIVLSVSEIARARSPALTFSVRWQRQSRMPRPQLYPPGASSRPARRRKAGSTAACSIRFSRCLPRWIGVAKAVPRP